ncbi:MAG TPA: hypothetical protein VHI52_03370, partial [Verrucomicrobiae bacterium]|nr:hypothetical protein [Verrucomicrobiae bacterium]
MGSARRHGWSVFPLISMLAAGCPSASRGADPPPLDDSQFKAALGDAAHFDTVEDAYRRAGGAAYNTAAIRWHMKHFALASILSTPRTGREQLAT